MLRVRVRGVWQHEWGFINWSCRPPEGSCDALWMQTALECITIISFRHLHWIQLSCWNGRVEFGGLCRKFMLMNCSDFEWIYVFWNGKSILWCCVLVFQLNFNNGFRNWITYTLGPSIIRLYGCMKTSCNINSCCARFEVRTKLGF